MWELRAVVKGYVTFGIDLSRVDRPCDRLIVSGKEIEKERGVSSDHSSTIP